MTALIVPRVTTTMMHLLLAHVAETFPDYGIVMEVDHAAWHRSNHRNIPENMRLVPQPARSPERNPVEHMWDYVREHALRTRLCGSLKKVIAALVDGVHDLAADAAALTSMTFFPHVSVV